MLLPLSVKVSQILNPHFASSSVEAAIANDYTCDFHYWHGGKTMAEGFPV